MRGGAQGWFVLAWAVPEPRSKPTAVTAVAITAIPANLLDLAYRVVMVTPLLKCCALPSPPTYSVNELRPPAGSKQTGKMCLCWQTVATSVDTSKPTQGTAGTPAAALRTSGLISI